MADWTGNKNSIYKTLGASNHTDKEREDDDFYATDPLAAQLLLEQEQFDGLIWEPSCGQGHLSKVFQQAGYTVLSTDLVDRGFGTGHIDFLDYRRHGNPLIKGEIDRHGGKVNIITNPPYKYAKEFVYEGLGIVPEGGKVCMFLKLQFLEGKERKRLFTEQPPATLYVSSSRITCAKNADFARMKAGGGSAVAYGWFVWVKGYKGNTKIIWIN